ncbi:MAG: hypothetical protein HYV97_01295 [Bdellovibrio sp.]|nr:hypothetical protein [Bdellovibrio sp.]
MKLNKNILQDVNIVILGSTDRTPMQIEVAIAEEFPFLETQIDSFDSYSDALDFCKGKKTVGFFIFDEEIPEIDFQNAFANLKNYYESLGWPAFYVLTHNGTESLSTYRMLKNDGRNLEYLDKGSLLDRDKLNEIFPSLVQSFVEKTKEALLPGILTSILQNMIAINGQTQSFLKQDRMLNLLAPSLSLSWIDLIKLEAAIYSGCMDLKQREELKEYHFLQQFESSLMMEQVSGFEYLDDKKVILAKRVFMFLKGLNVLTEPATLNAFKEHLVKKSPPGTGGVKKILYKNFDEIMQIAYNDRAMLKVA